MNIQAKLQRKSKKLFIDFYRIFLILCIVIAVAVVAVLVVLGVLKKFWLFCFLYIKMLIIAAKKQNF